MPLQTVLELEVELLHGLRAMAQARQIPVRCKD
jgi:hypothetical protein